MLLGARRTAVNYMDTEVTLATIPPPPSPLAAEGMGETDVAVVGNGLAMI
jgi:hypothetical protein